MLNTGPILSMQLWRKRQGQADLLAAAGELPLDRLLDLSERSQAERADDDHCSIALPLAQPTRAAGHGKTGAAEGRSHANEREAGSSSGTRMSADGETASTAEAYADTAAAGQGPVLHLRLAYSAQPCDGKGSVVGQSTHSQAAARPAQPSRPTLVAAAAPAPVAGAEWDLRASQDGGSEPFIHLGGSCLPQHLSAICLKWVGFPKGCLYVYAQGLDAYLSIVCS